MKRKSWSPRNIKRALLFVWQAEPRLMLANGALIVMQGSLPVIMLYLLKLVVDATAAGASASNKGAALGHVAVLIFTVIAVGLFSALCSALAKLVSAAQAPAVTDHMYGVLHAKCMEVDLEAYEDSEFLDQLRRAQQEATYRPTQIVTNLMEVGRNGIALMGIAGLLFRLNWCIALFLIVSSMPGALMRVACSRRLYRWQKQQTPLERLAWYFHWLITDSTVAKELRLYNLGDFYRHQFRDVRRKLRRGRLAIDKFSAVGDFVAQGGAMIAVFVAYGFIAYRTVQGLNTIGDLVLYYQAFQRGNAALLEFLGGLSSLYENKLFLADIDAFLEIQRRVQEPIASIPVPRPIQSGIRFDHVSFQYPQGTRPVLNDVSLTIHPGEIVAFVGKNGSGKTTLVKLLCRLYDPTGGSISLDGIDLHRFSTTALRQEISVVFQDYVHYQMTARENIRLGNIALENDHPMIVAAAQRAGADPVIMRLKEGYDTLLGQWFEGGKELSIGEWQRIALARAFVRDAQIIVLDEPSSAMDPQAELEFFDVFRHALGDRIGIIISHRFSTVRMANRIYVLEDGEIMECGTHEQLMERREMYAHLFEIQAQGYR